MIHTFMKSPLPNTLAVLVLASLVITWITSIVLSMGNRPVNTDQGWFAKLLPVFSLLGIPAATDLLQAGGLVLPFAGVVFIVFALNIVLPILMTARRSSSPLIHDWYKWSVLVSVIGGLAVAGYLTFIESTGAKVSCGPSGGCLAVQSSKYAILFGVLPVGILGLAGYVAILAAWLVAQFGPVSLRKTASVGMWALCIFGVLFSIYLTFLEPFVIGATCMWCLSSAVLMVILLLLSTPPALEALRVPDEDDEFVEAEGQAR